MISTELEREMRIKSQQRMSRKADIDAEAYRTGEKAAYLKEELGIETEGYTKPPTPYWADRSEQDN